MRYRNVYLRKNILYRMEIKRDKYLEKLISHQGNGLVKVITGIRRSGKSYLLFSLFKKHLLAIGISQNHILEFQLDDYANREFRNPDNLYKYVKERLTDNSKYYILLDEVQLLDHFEDVLNGFLRLENVEIYITGSNAKFLSKDIITEFRGRGDQIHVNPLSFGEFYSIKEGSPEKAWREYSIYGGLPPVVLCHGDAEKSELLNRLLCETYLTDIIDRNGVKNDGELEDLLSILASCIGSPTNPNKLSNTFLSEKKVAISPNTIKLYIDYFCDSFLLYKAMRYDIKGRKYIGTPSKYYFSDLGLRNVRLNFRQNEPTHIMENVIFNELLYRGFNVDVGNVVQNIKGKDGTSERKQLEVDFVCNLGDLRIYIQSAYSLPDRKKMEQEQNFLVKIDDSFKKLIVTMDNVSSYINEKGIVIVNLFDFLLNEKLLVA